MRILKVNGSHPLLGEIVVSGAKNSAFKLIPASLFANSDIYLSNIPRIDNLNKELEILKSLGGSYEWLGNNYLKINNSKLMSYEVPLVLGKNLFTTYLFAGPLLYRFGEAVLPLPDGGVSKIEKFIHTWRQLNIEINYDDNFIYLKSDNSSASTIEIPNASHLATDNAILSSISLNGTATLIDICENIEVKDLIEFCNLIGADITFENKRVLKINGQRHFKGADFQVVSDICEVLFFSLASLITKGNLIIKNIDKSNLSFLISFLTKIEASFDFPSNEELRVWNKSGELKSFDVTASSFPGIISDFIPLLCAQSLFCNGLSTLNDKSYKNKYEFIYKLNKSNSKIKIYEGLKDFEPCLIQIPGVVSDINIDKFELKSYDSILPMLLISLGLAKDTEILTEFDVNNIFENLVEKVVKLGGNVSYESDK
jgi:UDP-N-acetylglucosamine 1-carboxyvinyltransferase